MLQLEAILKRYPNEALWEFEPDMLLVCERFKLIEEFI